MTGERRAAVRWWSLVFVLSVALASGISGALYFGGQLDQARADRDALRDQVRELGGTPVAGPSGKAGAAGEDGTDGQDGRDGRDGRTGEAGATGQPGPHGPSGAAGTPGTDGAPGQAGVDGSAGPPGAVGPTGPAGPSGPPGERGDKGDTGEPGTNVTCAEGYHPEDIVIVPYSGTYQVCRKDDPADN